MRRQVMAIAIAAALAACERTPPAEVDNEAIDAIVTVVEDELNGPPLAIMGLMRASAQEAQVGWDTLFISPNGEPEPVNWWLQKRGFLALSGAQFATRAVFTLTKPAQDMIASPDEPWFEAQATGEPTIDCETAAAMASNGCEVAIEVTPVLTPAGRSAIGQPAVPLQPLSVTAVVTLGPEEWEVSNLGVEGVQLIDVALNAILGGPDARQAAARSADSSMKGQLAVMAGETEPAINLDAWTPPNYVEPPPPVAPLERPKLGPETPFRPGL